MIPQDDAGFPDPNGPQPQPVAGRIEPTPVFVPRQDAVPPGLSSGPDAWALLLGLRRRLLLALTLGGTLAGLAAVAAYVLMAPKYTGSSQVRVLYSQPDIFGEAGSGSNFASYLKSQAGMMKSRPVIQAALKRDEVKRLNLDGLYTDPVGRLDEELKVESVEGSELLTLTYGCSDPGEAVAVVKAVTDSYMELVAYAEKQRRSQRVLELEKAVNEARTAVSRKMDRMEGLVKALGTDKPGEVAQALEEYRFTMRDLQQQRTAMQTERGKAEAALEAHKIRGEFLKNASIPESTVEAALDADPVAKPLLLDLGRARAVAQRFESAGLTGEPTYHKAAGMVATIEPQVEKRRVALREDLRKRTLDAAQQDYEANLAILQQTLKSMDKQLARCDEVIKELAGRQIQQAKHSTELETLQHEIAEETRALDELRLRHSRMKTDLGAPDRILVHQEADLQKRDTKKQVLATVAAPVAVFFAVCLGLAYGDSRQRRVRTVGQVANGLGIRVVGAVPEAANIERHLCGPVTDPDFDAQPVLESVDAIRTLLLHDSQQDPCRVVQVTSAVSGEGKTTLASHLATSLARSGRKTLLIDADLRRPTLHQLFELPQQPGLSEVLLGEVESAEAVQATTLEGLSVLPAGQWDREVMQSLARGGLEGVFEKLRQDFDFLVLDSHAVLPATDSLLIAQQVDAVILSVRRDLSQTPRVYAAAQRLQALNVRVLGAVLNGGDPEEVTGGPAAPAPLPAAA